jgi:alpha-galactosidase
MNIPRAIFLCCARCVVAFFIGGIANVSAFSGEAAFAGCYAHWSNSELVMGNSLIERKWNIYHGRLVATAFRDLKTGYQWISEMAPAPTQLSASTFTNQNTKNIIDAQVRQLSPVSAKALVVNIVASGEATVHYNLTLFPLAQGIDINCFGSSGDNYGTNDAKALKKTSDTPTGYEKPDSNTTIVDSGDSLEDLILAPQHLRLTQVNLMDQTDRHNELVSEREWLLMKNEQPIFARGNLFIIEDVITGNGLIFLKEAPLPDSRPLKNDFDFIANPGAKRFQLCGHGYPFVVLAYHGSRIGRIEALQNYQRQVREYDSARDGLFLSNTWGDRSQDSRINEKFMEREILAGARLGVDVIQMDDGWQQGRSANSANGKGSWAGFWATNQHFWNVNSQRFPNGISNLVESANEHGMKFGLWYAPDSSGNFTNWERDADQVLHFWRTEGIRYFKFDSINIASPLAQDNLGHLFRRVLDKSGGEIVVDLDVTAGIRPGYFGAMKVGPIFVENRYTDFHRYWPHQTLRNLWQLAQYIDPLRLRMEFLNNERNTNQYANDPLAPSAYSPDCLFATVMCANPLGWFEASNLSSNYIESVSNLVRIWNQNRSELQSGNMIPIGSVPDGVNWTGFASVSSGRSSGFLLVFRELDRSADWQSDVSMFANPLRKLTVLAGDGTANIVDGKPNVHINNPLGYLWLRVDAGGVGQ